MWLSPQIPETLGKMNHRPLPAVRAKSILISSFYWLCCTSVLFCRTLAAITAGRRHFHSWHFGIWSYWVSELFIYFEGNSAPHPERIQQRPCSHARVPRVGMRRRSQESRILHKVPGCSCAGWTLGCGCRVVTVGVGGVAERCGEQQLQGCRQRRCMFGWVRA